MATTERVLAAVVEALARLRKDFDTQPKPVDGKDGRDGKDGAPGRDGVDGRDGKDGLDGQPGRDGIDGKDGIDGRDGRDGVDGKDGQDGINGKDGRNGLDGKDGRDGVDGQNGTDGRDGTDGVGIENIEQTGQDTALIRLTDGREVEIKLPRGRDGRDGITQTIVRGGGVPAEAGTATAPAPAPAERLSLIAAQPIIAFKVVTTDAQGRGIYADAGTAAHVDQVIGLAATAAQAGGAFEVIESGVAVNSGWNWSAGQPLFLGLNGDIVTQPVGVFSLQIGYAKSSTEVYVRIGRGVLRA